MAANCNNCENCEEGGPSCSQQLTSATNVSTFNMNNLRIRSADRDQYHIPERFQKYYPVNDVVVRNNIIKVGAFLDNTANSVISEMMKEIIWTKRTYGNFYNPDTNTTKLQTTLVRLLTNWLGCKIKSTSVYKFPGHATSMKRSYVSSQQGTIIMSFGVTRNFHFYDGDDEEFLILPMKTGDLLYIGPEDDDGLDRTKRYCNMPIFDNVEIGSYTVMFRVESEVESDFDQVRKRLTYHHSHIPSGTIPYVPTCIYKVRKPSQSIIDDSMKINRDIIRTCRRLREQQLTKDDIADECLICCEPLRHTLPTSCCGSRYHGGCLIKSGNLQCPFCRAPVDIYYSDPCLVCRQPMGWDQSRPCCGYRCHKHCLNDMGQCHQCKSIPPPDNECKLKIRPAILLRCYKYVDQQLEYQRQEAERLNQEAINEVPLQISMVNGDTINVVGTPSEIDVLNAYFTLRNIINEHDQEQQVDDNMVLLLLNALNSNQYDEE